MHRLKSFLQGGCLLALLLVSSVALQGAQAETTPATPPAATQATPPAATQATPPAATPDTSPAAPPATPAAQPESPAPSPAPAAPATQPEAPVPSPAPAPQAAPAPEGDAANATPIDVVARPAALLRGNSSWDDGYKNLTAAFKKINAEITKAGLKAAGRPITAFIETDDKGFRFEAMIPLEKSPDGKDALTPEVRLGQTPAGKAMKFQHRGAYDDIDSTYEALTAFMDEKGLEARDLFVEEYLNDMKAAEDPGTQIDIYVYLK